MLPATQGRGASGELFFRSFKARTLVYCQLREAMACTLLFDFPTLLGCAGGNQAGRVRLWRISQQWTALFADIEFFTTVGPDIALFYVSNVRRHATVGAEMNHDKRR
jgi:hypothetical protein